MITVTGIYAFEGYEESKSHTDGTHYIYLKPICPPDQGILKNVKVKPEFGNPLDAMEKTGAFGVLAPREKIPTLAIGQKVAGSFHLWPVQSPRWDFRKNCVGFGNYIKTVYTLNGEIKPSNAKATPPTINIDAFFAGAVRNEENGIALSIILDDMPPEGVLVSRSIEKGKSYIQAMEQLGHLTPGTTAGILPALASGTAITAEGTIWPVSEPKWDKEAGQIGYNVVATARINLTKINETKTPVETKAS